MNPLFDEIDHLQKELDRLSPLKDEDQYRLDEKFRLEFNYNSNHIEGNTLTYGETKLLLIFDKTTGNHDMREYEEMKAHDVAFEFIHQWAKETERPLSEANIKNLHELLLVRPFWKDAITPEGQSTRRKIKVGAYKEYPNSVQLQNGEIFHYATPQETPILMGELIEWYRTEEEKRELHPVALAALLHYKFVRIHPFDDGNGRMSRLLMNYVLLKNNLPPVIIKTGGKKDYLFALNQADTGNLDAFVDYIVEQLFWSFEISIKAARGENVDEPGDLEKKIAGLKREFGQDKDEAIKSTYNLSVFYHLIAKTISPLISDVEVTLQKFDTFFFSRVNTIMLDSTHDTGKNIFVLLDAILRNNKDFLPAKINFQAEFKRFINSEKQSSVNGGRIDVQFHENLYEITYSGGTKPIRRFYHQQLTDAERKEIVSTVGNWAYSNIEKAIKSDKQ